MSNLYALDETLDMLNNGKSIDYISIMYESMCKEISDFSVIFESGDVILNEFSVENIKEKIKKIWDNFKEFVVRVFNRIKDFLKEKKDNMKSKLLEILKKVKEKDNKDTSVKEAAEEEVDFTVIYYETTDKNGKVSNKVKVGQLTESNFNKAVADNKSKFLQNVFTMKGMKGVSLDKLESAYQKVEDYIDSHQVPKIELNKVEHIKYDKHTARTLAIKFSEDLLNHDFPALDKMNEALKYVNDESYKVGLDVVNEIIASKYSEEEQQRVSTILSKFSAKTAGYLSEWLNNVNKFSNDVLSTGNYYLKLAASL